MTAQISVNNLHKNFGVLEVLKGIDLEISKGEVVCVIGPSGLREINTFKMHQPSRGTDTRRYHCR